METIRIYHSLWRMLLLVLVSFVFAFAGFFMTILFVKLYLLEIRSINGIRVQKYSIFGTLPNNLY